MPKGIPRPKKPPTTPDLMEQVNGKWYVNGSRYKEIAVKVEQDNPALIKRPWLYPTILRPVSAHTPGRFAASELISFARRRAQGKVYRFFTNVRQFNGRWSELYNLETGARK